MKLITFENGSIAYNDGVEARDERREERVDGDTTFVNVTSAREGVPAHFCASFIVQFRHGVPGAEQLNTLNLQTSVEASARNDGYSDIETAAAQQLPALLREVADALEAELSED